MYTGACATIEPTKGPSYGLLGSMAPTALASVAAMPPSTALGSRSTTDAAGGVGVAPGGGSCLHPADHPKAAPAVAATATNPKARAPSPPSPDAPEAAGALRAGALRRAVGPLREDFS